MQLNKYLQLLRTIIEQLVTGNITELLRFIKSSLGIVQKDINSLLLPYIVDGQLIVPKKQRYKLLKKLDKTLLKQAKELGEKDIEVTTKLLNEAASESYYRTAFLMESGQDKPIDVKPLKSNEMKAIINTPVKEEMFSDRIWKNKKKLVKQVRYSVEQALINGTDPKKLAKEVKRIFGVSTYESERLIFNEVARVHRQAQDQVFEQMKVKKVMFDATLDKKTSKYCREHDGRIYEFGKHPNIPEDSHVGCRSDIIPVVDGWKPTVKKENIKNEDGVKPLIDYSNYEEWMKHKGFK
jgi:SPP1 gp7 family putative phage head morphogenesis protein